MESSQSILLIEDDVIDILAVKRALNAIQAPNPLFFVNNGEEALDFLRNENNSRPGLILLDLNMPRMNGLEFLEIVKHDRFLKIIPVVVLTTSQEQQDKMQSFSLNVAGYMIKPVNDQEFMQTLEIIHDYWSMSEVPTGLQYYQ